ncbi:MAG: c-type cytochrome [Planctomycetes bacterium]|nr:c-type cytochrome [Planctomycetota bacterium]
MATNDTATPDNTPEQDPITSKSLGTHILFWSALTFLTVIWAGVDEFIVKRPYLDYQSEFREVYAAALDAREAKAREDMQIAHQDPAVEELDEEIKALKQELEGQRQELQNKLQDLGPRIEAISEGYREKNSMIAALRYKIDVAPEGSSLRDARLKELEDLRARKVAIAMPNGETIELDSDEFDKSFKEWKDQRSELQKQLGALMKPLGDLEKERKKKVALLMPSVDPTEIANLRTKIEDMTTGIKQIHVKEFELIDRCESCHLGTREPLILTAEDMQGHREFISHPNPELLAIHDPEKYGCSPCHNGNGIGTISVEKGHGRHHYWLWPLWEPDNYEAGCLQCHRQEIYVPHADTLNDGRELFRHKGCWGCHRYEGYDEVSEELKRIDQEIVQLQDAVAQANKDVTFAYDSTPNDLSDEERDRLSSRYAAEATNRKIGLEFQLDEARTHKQDMLNEKKRPGPSLKELKAKIEPHWLEQWIANPHEFRPGTRMPVFRLEDDQIKAIAAFVWQRATDPATFAADRAIPQHAKGDAANGKELFETRGCMACHAIDGVGSDWAADLSRVGEKAKYDYLVEWVKNPRKRNPNAVMPNLRLTEDEAKNIASYLETRKSNEPIPVVDTTSLNDESLAADGLRYVLNYGCAGCHEIGGLESEGRIGTELTAWGSKPIERIDFGLHTHNAHLAKEDPNDPIGAWYHEVLDRYTVSDDPWYEEWYNKKGFAMRKLKQPEYFDQGKFKPDRLEKLKMPNFMLADEEIVALTTFLRGSTEPGFQIEENMAAPMTGDRKAIAEGWWIVQKYNCLGCHKIRPEQDPPYWTLPRFQNADTTNNAVTKDKPPSLIGIGARLDPIWFAKFLANPALSATDVHRNGVRTYVETRMPSFDLSEREISQLIRFFRALSEQPPTYVPEVPAGFQGENDPDLAFARELTQKVCFKCHNVASFAETNWQNAPGAPFIHAPQRLSPEWIQQWLEDPTVMIQPLTGMPSVFAFDEGEQRWVCTDSAVTDLRDRYKGDHIELLKRYLMHFNETENAALSGK